MTTQIAPDSKVTLHFELKFENGDIIDSNFDKEAATFAMGDGSLLPGFEKKLFGLTAAEKATFTVMPEDGFGQPNPNNIQSFKRDTFADDMELYEGLVVSFADASQSELPGVIKSVDEEVVIVDFNHPLAGEKIIFDVEIIAVDAA
ncbi:MAG: FKBP-type peptidyl-prolyl cis-trans isomerase SlpA [Pseudohongiellaceae bacterium]|jgi:FKBP-type peptidyl-prolyl cis-trans isomerase SlpA